MLVWSGFQTCGEGRGISKRMQGGSKTFVFKIMWLWDGCGFSPFLCSSASCLIKISNNTEVFSSKFEVYYHISINRSTGK